MLTEKLIDPLDLKYRALLEGIQGNILKAHGRDYMTLVLLAFRPERMKAARQWIADTGARVGSALKLTEEAKAFREGRPGGTFCSLLLSAAGCDALGWLERVPRSDGKRLAEFPRPPLGSDRGPGGVETDRFCVGMRRMAAALGDTGEARPVLPWERPYSDSCIHAMLIVAADRQDEVERECQHALTRPGADGLLWLGSEHGRRRTNADGLDVEPFGYVDGLSQPKFYATDVADERATGGGTRVWDPAFPLSQVLVRTEEAERETYGSFCVFRKLEQDVPGFHASMRALADQLGLEAADRERAGAMILGRFPDGTPLQLQSKPGMAHPPTNDFDYRSTPPTSANETDEGDGTRCPFHAHIRKANPRRAAQRGAVLARRGMPYGAAPLARGETEGLLFLAYMADIEHQFLELQGNWMQDSSFPRPALAFTGSDPLLLPETNRGHEFPLAWGNASKGRVSIPRLQSFVTPRGGEYFFAPPRDWLLAAINR